MEYLAVRMLFEKLLDLLLIALDLTQEGLELGIDPHQSIQATRANMGWDLALTNQGSTIIWGC